MRYFLLLILGCLLMESCASYSKSIRNHREHYKEEFLLDERSPLDSSGINGLVFYKPNKEARVEASFVLTPEAKPFELPTYSGITRTYRQFGVATFLWKNDSTSLALYESIRLMGNPMYKDYLFLPFKDETNGLATYGGGRYLNMSKADTEDGKVMIDFNLCYNPWCAYSDGFNCPIPPVENHLPFAIEAGEKNYEGAYKKAEDHE